MWMCSTWPISIAILKPSGWLPHVWHQTDPSAAWVPHVWHQPCVIEGLDADRLPDQDHRRVAGHVVALDDQYAGDLRTHSHLLAQARIFVWHHMLLDALERGVEVRHDLLTANHQDEVTRARRVRSHLASGGRCLDELPLLCQRVHAADLEVGRGHELAHLAGLRVALQLERLEAK